MKDYPKNAVQYGAPKPMAARETARRERFTLSLDESVPKAMGLPRNPDPYNTSGSFDRTKNWARVGKR